MAVKKTKKVKSRVAKVSPAKSKSAKPATKKVNKPAGKRGGFHRDLDPGTGFVVGTESHTIAEALIAGGDSRVEIAGRLEKVLPAETKKGTPKQVNNMMGGVLGKLLARGYTVEQSFKVNEPTPASKRAATRAANKKAAEPAPAKKSSKPAAKKSAAKGKKGAAAKKGK